MFDWERFLKDHRIPYQIGGKNTKAGNIGLNCPLCAQTADPDPSTHLGIDPRTGSWNCWRSSTHIGKSPYKLVKALLKLSHRETISLLREYGDKRSKYSTLEEIDNESHISRRNRERTSPSWPRGFTKTPKEVHYSFLQKRGFPKGLRKYIEDYHLYYGQFNASKSWRFSIVIPVKNEDGKLMTWTARYVGGKSLSRYTTLPADEEAASRMGCDPAVMDIKKCLLLPDPMPQQGFLMTVSEGPFDALKLALGMRLAGVEGLSTCTFGLNLTQSQYWKLRKLVPRFTHNYFVLDKGAESEALHYGMTFAGMIRESPVALPDGCGDPGDLSPKQARDYIRRLADHAKRNS